MPTAAATTRAVTGASPVTITVLTPRSRNWATRAAESSRGGSLRAITPAMLKGSLAPMATARTRNPWADSSSTIAAAAGDGLAMAATTVKAPLTIRTGAPWASAADASDIFRAGSNGVKLTSFHGVG